MHQAKHICRVKIDIPLKQGLKQKGDIWKLGEHRVKIDIPLKQGLKPECVWAEVVWVWVKIDIPLKQGLKHLCKGVNNYGK